MSDIHTMIGVGIVEDDSVVRDAIQNYINAQKNMCCDLAAGSAEAFLAGLSEANVPDVVLMDIGLPGMSGIGAIRILKERFPETDTIMLTVYHDVHKIFQSLCAGASGYLLKDTPFSEIKEAIEVVHAGGASMSPQVARRVLHHFHPAHPSAESASPLTAKEKEIVLGLVEGLSYKMIADNQGVTIETVRAHIKSIYRKLHVHSKAEVISKSLRGEI